jgi:hypothetical protein
MMLAKAFLRFVAVAQAYGFSIAPAVAATGAREGFGVRDPRSGGALHGAPGGGEPIAAKSGTVRPARQQEPESAVALL